LPLQKSIATPLSLSHGMDARSPKVPAAQSNADFMEKDSKRFADSGGWGWGSFDYDAASDTFSPATTADNPPQGHDAKCGFACHTLVKNRDYVFTEFAHR
jgi:Cytochrome P460